jgi:hypothetical protein
MPTKLSENPVHLGLGASAEIQPDYTGDMAWYEAYSARNASDGAEGRLVTIHCFSESWTSWEMHPLGCEVVLCTQGRITLIQERCVEHCNPECWRICDQSSRCLAYGGC